MLWKPFIIPQTLHPKIYIPENNSIYIIIVCQRATGRSDRTAQRRQWAHSAEKWIFEGGGIRTKLGIRSYYVAFE
jgi:hypothetical protein